MSNDSLHNPSPPPKISNATKRRINKAKRQGLKPGNVEIDGGRIQALPTFIGENAALQVAGPPEIHVTTANFQPNHGISLQPFSQLAPQNYPSHVFVPRGGGGVAASVRDASNDTSSSSSGMDEVDARLCDKPQTLPPPTGSDSVVLRKDLMMPQDGSPDSGMEAPDDIESDGHVSVQNVLKIETCVTDTVDVTEKTAGLTLTESVCAVEECTVTECVEARPVNTGENTHSETCDQSGKDVIIVMKQCDIELNLKLVYFTINGAYACLRWFFTMNGS